MATLRKTTNSTAAPEKEPKPRLRLYRNDSVEIEDAPPRIHPLRFPGAVLGDLIYPDVVARQACFWGGLVFGVVGVLESFFPGISGVASLSRYHGLFYLAASAALILPAMMLAPARLATASSFLGLAFGAVAFLGFLLGSGEADRFYWALLPGSLEFSSKDHILLGAVGLLLMLSSVRGVERGVDRGEGLGRLDEHFH